jgi:hypothetical protein
MGGACSTNGEKRNAYRILVGSPVGKRSLGRTRCRWVDNIKWDLRKIEWGGVDWIDMAQDRDQWRTQNSGKFLTGCTNGGSSRRAQVREEVSIYSKTERPATNFRNVITSVLTASVV